MTRLALAFATGLPKPAGPTVVIYPNSQFDLVDLVNVQIVHPFHPINRVWSDRNLKTTVMLPAAHYDLAVVCCTRSKKQTADLIAQAAHCSDIVVVDGQKTDGIESHYKALRKQLDVNGTITKAHGRLFWFAGTDLDHMRSKLQVVDGFTTQAGVFSVGSIDAGSELLVQSLPKDMVGNIADLGAGWGYLSSKILGFEAVTNIDLVEANHIALECAKLNVADPRANFHWADATQWAGCYDAVVMNPPFHTGRTGDIDLGRSFMAAASRILSSKGSLYMVANRHLPYETFLNECFGKVVEQPGDARFKLFHATRPKRK